MHLLTDVMQAKPKVEPELFPVKASVIVESSCKSSHQSPDFVFSAKQSVGSRRTIKRLVSLLYMFFSLRITLEFRARIWRSQRRRPWNELLDLPLTSKTCFNRCGNVGVEPMPLSG